MEKIKVTIVVPVYKVEKYLRRSMDSLVNQTLDGVEIICINDGSPDNSLNILKEYKEKYLDKHIVIIDKQNEGTWKGRLDGIAKATGEYIGFVDSDDYVALDYAEKLYNAAKSSNSDITVCGFKRVNSETGNAYSTEMNQFAGKVIDMDKNPEDILSINTGLCNKLCKTELVKNIRILPKNPKIFEDMICILLIYMNTKKITFIEDSLYYYMVRPDSTMGTIKKEHVESTQNALLEVKKIYAKENATKELLSVIDAMAFIHLGVSLMIKVSEDKTSNFKEELKKSEKYLNENFLTWKTTQYLNLFYCLKHKCNVKPAIIRIIYKLRLFRPFINVYNFMINKLKIDIKW